MAEAIEVAFVEFQSNLDTLEAQLTRFAAKSKTVGTEVSKSLGDSISKAARAAGVGDSAPLQSLQQNIAKATQGLERGLTAVEKRLDSTLAKVNALAAALKGLPSIPQSNPAPSAPRTPNAPAPPSSIPTADFSNQAAAIRNLFQAGNLAADETIKRLQVLRAGVESYVAALEQAGNTSSREFRSLTLTLAQIERTITGVQGGITRLGIGEQIARALGGSFNQLESELKGIRAELAATGSLSQAAVQRLTQIQQAALAGAQGVDRLSQEFRDLNRLAAEANQTLNQAKRGMQGIRDTLTNLASAGGGVQAFRSLGKFVNEAQQAELQVQRLNRAIENAGPSAAGANQVIERLANTFRVSTADLNGPVATLLNLGATSQQIEQLLLRAGASARNAGREFKDGFENITTALASGSSQALQSIGIASNFGEAYTKVAEKLKGASAETIRQAQAQALLNAITPETESDVRDLAGLFGNEYLNATNAANQATAELRRNLGQALTPAFTALQNLVAKTAEAFNALPASLRTVLANLALLGAGFLAVVGAVGLLGPVLSNGINLIRALGPVVANTIRIITSANPIVLALTAAVGALYLAWRTNFLGIRDLTQAVIERVGRVLEQVPVYVAGVRGVLSTLGSLWRGTFQAIGTITEGFRLVVEGAFLDPLGKMLQGVRTALGPIVQGFRDFGLRIAQFFQPVADFLANIGSGIAEGLNRALAGLRGGVAAGLGRGLEVAQREVERLAGSSDKVRRGLDLISEGGRQLQSVLGTAIPAVSASWNAYTREAQAALAATDKTDKAQKALTSSTQNLGVSLDDGGKKARAQVSALEILKSRYDAGLIGVEAFRAGLEGLLPRLESQVKTLKAGSPEWQQAIRDYTEAKKLLGELANLPLQNRIARINFVLENPELPQAALERIVGELRGYESGLLKTRQILANTSKIGTDAWNANTSALENVRTALGKALEKLERFPTALEALKDRFAQVLGGVGEKFRNFLEGGLERVNALSAQTARSFLDQAAALQLALGEVKRLGGFTVFSQADPAAFQKIIDLAEQLRTALASGAIPEAAQQTVKDVLEVFDQGIKTLGDDVTQELNLELDDAFQRGLKQSALDAEVSAWLNEAVQNIDPILFRPVFELDLSDAFGDLSAQLEQAIANLELGTLDLETFDSLKISLKEIQQLAQEGGDFVLAKKAKDQIDAADAAIARFFQTASQPPTGINLPDSLGIPELIQSIQQAQEAGQNLDLTFLADLFKNVDFGSLGQELLQQLNVLAVNLDTLAAQNVPGAAAAAEILARGLSAVTFAVRDLDDEQKDNLTRFREWLETLQEAARKSEQLEAAQGLLARAFEAGVIGLAEFQAGTARTIQGYQALIDSGQLTADQVTLLQIAIANLKTQLQDVSTAPLVRGLELTRAELEAGLTGLGEYQRAIAQLIRRYEDLMASGNLTEEQTRQLRVEIAKLRKELEDTSKTRLENIANDITAIGNAARSVLDAFKGGQTVGQIYSSIIGNVGGLIADAIVPGTGAIVRALAPIIGGIIDELLETFSSGAENVSERFKETAKQFTLIGAGAFEGARVGYFQDYLGGLIKVYKEKVDEAKLSLLTATAQALEQGALGGLRNGLKAFFDGKSDWYEALKAGIREAIINAIIEAVIQGAIIKGALAGPLEALTKAIAAGDQAGINAAIGQINAALPGLIQTLQQVLGPLRDTINRYFPQTGSPTPEPVTPPGEPPLVASNITGIQISEDRNADVFHNAVGRFSDAVDRQGAYITRLVEEGIRVPTQIVVVRTDGALSGELRTELAGA